MIYEKLQKGIRVFNGVFLLVDGWTTIHNDQSVFRFRFEVDENVSHPSIPHDEIVDAREHPRVIPGRNLIEIGQHSNSLCQT
jgi:hypothetical protein